MFFPSMATPTGSYGRSYKARCLIEVVSQYFLEWIVSVYFWWPVGGLEHFLYFHISGILFPTDFIYFQRGWNHQSEYLWNISSNQMLSRTCFWFWYDLSLLSQKHIDNYENKGHIIGPTDYGKNVGVIFCFSMSSNFNVNMFIYGLFSNVDDDQTICRFVRLVVHMMNQCQTWWIRLELRPTRSNKLKLQVLPHRDG